MKEMPLERFYRNGWANSYIKPVSLFQVFGQICSGIDVLAAEQALFCLKVGIFSSRFSGRDNRISLVCLSVCNCGTYIVCHFNGTAKATLMKRALICIYHENIIISFHPLLKGHTHVILKYIVWPSLLWHTWYAIAFEYALAICISSSE